MDIYGDQKKKPQDSAIDDSQKRNILDMEMPQAYEWGFPKRILKSKNVIFVFAEQFCIPNIPQIMVLHSHFVCALAFLTKGS